MCLQDYTDIPKCVEFNPKIRNIVELRSSSEADQGTTSADSEMPLFQPIPGKYYAVFGDSTQGYYLVRCVSVTRTSDTFYGKYLCTVISEDTRIALFKETFERDSFEFETVVGEVISATKIIVNNITCISVSKVELNDIIEKVAEIDDN